MFVIKCSHICILIILHVLLLMWWWVCVWQHGIHVWCALDIVCYVIRSTPWCDGVKLNCITGSCPLSEHYFMGTWLQIMLTDIMICTCVIVVGSFLYWQRIQNAVRDILSFLFFGCFQIGWLPFCFKNELLSVMDII